MNLRAPFLIASVALLMPFCAAAASAFTSLHPEEAYPDNAAPLALPGPYAGFIKQVQEKLHAQGFDAGPVNGDFGSKTQAALAQFQLSRGLPASGGLDDRTLAELGVKRDAGESASTSAQDGGLRASCDALVGPEKEHCLQQGGTVEAGAQSSSGASRPPAQR
jgi:peptidoglycan hydrolase-like protein with peptidoglycan-binding domain